MAANKAFNEGPWPKMTALERVRVLEKACGLIEANIEKLATMVGKETGRSNAPVPFCSLEISGSVVEVIKYFCAQALTYEGTSNTTYNNNVTTLTVVEPVGVVAGIVPWNFPLMLFTHKVAPALAAGCTVVIKSSPFTAGSTYELALLLQKAGLPPGVLNVITGLGNVVGATLASHPLVAKVSFTGSIEASKKVIAASSSNLKKVTIEAGGKSPNIIFKDTDLDALFAPNSFFPFSCILHSGQVCAIGSRLLVHEDIKDKVVERLKALFEGPFKVVGAITMKEQLQKIEEYVKFGKEEKATLVCGGTRLTDGDYSKGHYFASTIFTDVTPSMKIFQDEIFGPVLSVVTFKTTEEAIALANSVIQGLACMVWSNNITTVMECCKKIKAGFFMVNKFGAPGPHEAFGGLKQSGIGKELGKEGYQAYLDIKTVSFSC